MIDTKCLQNAIDLKFPQHLTDLKSLLAAISVQTDHLTVLDQSRVADNIGVIELTAELVAFTRSIEPSGVTISLGGEIGEVGEHNSTIEELDAYLSGYNGQMNHRSTNQHSTGNHSGLTKISVQTGTRH